MNLSPEKLAQGLVDEILDVIHKYDETMLMPTVLGCLEIIKVQLLEDCMNEGEEE